ncbi:hypothetical protein JJD62_28055, partial [Pseudomonas haemolytica]|nr:hypothetical protein [Pseudomonas haemolytica]
KKKNKQELRRFSILAINHKVREQMLAGGNAIMHTKSAGFGRTVQIKHRPDYEVLRHKSEENEIAQQVVWCLP